MRSQSGLGIFLLKVYERYQCPSFVTFLDPTNNKHFYLEADFNMGRICKYFPHTHFQPKNPRDFALGRTQHFKDSPSEHCPHFSFHYGHQIRKNLIS